MPSREQEILAQIIASANGQLDVRLEDFRYDISQDMYWWVTKNLPLREARSINAAIPTAHWAKAAPNEEGKEELIKPSTYLATVDNGLAVTTSTWWPGKPTIIKGYLTTEGSMVEDPQSVMYNSYKAPDRPPPASKKSPMLAKPWLDHVATLYPNEKDRNYLLDLFAHMVQKPEEKTNVMVAFSGEQGIGKDVMLKPVKAAVGADNVKDISPDDFASNYTPYVQCVMLVINEVHATKEDFHASSIYERLKRLAVTPPDTLPLTAKYFNTRYIVNVLRVFITTNDMNGIFIPANDRRFLLMHSTLKTNWASQEYFTNLNVWFAKGGNEEVAQFLWARDISKFEPKRPAEKTEAWKAVVSGWGAPDDDIGKVIDKLEKPPVFFPIELDGFNDDEIMKLRRAPRRFIHRMQQSGYMVLPVDLRFKSTLQARPDLVFKKAYVQVELINDPNTYRAMLMVRGQKLANGESVSPSPPPPDPENVTPIRGRAT